MVKDNDAVMQEWNEIINMSPQELKTWLNQEESSNSGWTKDDGSNETAGHESGRKIIAVLESNPSKDPSKYSEDDLSQMRKVVSYCKRHLAQEKKAKQNTASKSYKSLKNWGHDSLKSR